MIPMALSDVTFDDLLSLIDGRVREGKTIDYKRELPGGADEHKREFLADVSSLANASGGDILFGALEEQGLPTSFPGVDPADMDQVTLRLENLIRTGIEPRLPGIGGQSRSCASEAASSSAVIFTPRQHLETVSALQAFP